MARAAWPAAVGKRIANHAVAAGLVRGRLVVEVEDAVWQRQLFTLRAQIVNKVAAVIGPGIVQALEFRVRVPRPMPQREERAARPADDADEIEDPVLRALYKAARKRALA